MLTPCASEIQVRRWFVINMEPNWSDSQAGRFDLSTSEGVTKRFVLYGTTACHLCETAEALLVDLRATGVDLHYEKYDIAESDELFQRYGVHIPVLMHPNGAELFWPFDADAVKYFCAA